MATPESHVKDAVKRVLKRLNSYYFMPPMNGYGASGVPDIVACLDGKFIAVEAKANGNKPTMLQLKNLKSIVAAGGYAFVVDETSVGIFTMMMDSIVNGVLPRNDVIDLTKT